MDASLLLANRSLTGVVHLLRRLPGKSWQRGDDADTPALLAASRTRQRHLVRTTGAYDWTKPGTGQTTSTLVKHVKVINARRTIYRPIHRQHLSEGLTAPTA